MQGMSSLTVSRILRMVVPNYFSVLVPILFFLFPCFCAQKLQKIAGNKIRIKVSEGLSQQMWNTINTLVYERIELLVGVTKCHYLEA